MSAVGALLPPTLPCRFLSALLVNKGNWQRSTHTPDLTEHSSLGRWDHILCGSSWSSAPRAKQNYASGCVMREHRLLTWCHQRLHTRVTGQVNSTQPFVLGERLVFPGWGPRCHKPAAEFPYKHWWLGKHQPLSQHDHGLTRTNCSKHWGTHREASPSPLISERLPLAGVSCFIQLHTCYPLCPLGPCLWTVWAQRTDF